MNVVAEVRIRILECKCYIDKSLNNNNKNLNKKCLLNKILSSTIMAVVVVHLRPSLSHRAFHHQLFVDLTLTIQEGKFALSSKVQIHMIHLLAKIFSDLHRLKRSSP